MIDTDYINDRFKDRKGTLIGNYKKAAVMILLQEASNGKVNVVFEVRSKKLKTQPMDVCLPGGRIEEGESPREAAIRETMEELMLQREDIEFIGDMDYLVTPYNLIMYVFLSKTSKENLSYSLDEVDHIFTVPLEFFINNDPFLYNLKIGPIDKSGFPFHLINGGEDYKFRTGFLKEYFYKYNGYVIWGFTAEIIKAFVDLIKNGII